MTHDPEGFVRMPRLLEQGHPFRQWKTWEIPGTPFTLTGYSRANDKTFFHIPELRCCIDAGLCEGRQPDTILLTHTHHDHSSDIEFMVGKSTGVDLYVPGAAAPYVERHVRALRELNHCAAFDPSLASEMRMHPVGGDDTLALGKRGAYQVRVVECIHKVPCVGYCFSERQARLVPELARTQAEMLAANEAAAFGRLVAQRRQQGLAVYEDHLRPRFAFLGDTHARVFEQNPWLFDYPVLVTECTYLDDAEEERANRVGHTVWKQLRPHIAAHPEVTFVLTHFSLRHSDREVIDFFEAELRRERLENVVVWAHRGSAMPEQHQRRDT